MTAGSPTSGGNGSPRQTAARVRVTSPRRRSSRRPALGGREIDPETGLGQVYMRTLIRAQFRLALLVLAVAGVVLLGLPLSFALFPGLGSVTVFGIALPWLILGGLVHPAMVGAAWFYTRQAERNERAFTELVERS